MILVSIVVLVSIVSLAAVAVPKDFRVERQIVVEKSQATVFNFLKQVSRQDSWNPWSRKDPELKKEYRGRDGTVGFVYAWSGTKAGSGEQEVTSTQEGSRIDFELRFSKPFKAKNGAYLTAEPEGSERTHVRWGMTGRMPFPMNLMHLVMKGKLSRDFDEGLGLLKGILEQ